MGRKYGANPLMKARNLANYSRSTALQGNRKTKTPKLPEFIKVPCRDEYTPHRHR